MATQPSGRRSSRGPVTAGKGPALPVGGAFPIVGIGASAGGLEALDQLLRNLPPTSGLAFVVVQHLDPTQKGLLPELLQRSTPIPVVQITDNMPVEPDHVYVIPPNRDLAIANGVLHLLEPIAPRGLRLPIDSFLRSLAEDRHEHALAVILSGMGSDGTMGLRAIKEKAGAVFVQDPATAKFDSMPRSAIDSGLTDIVAPAEELGARIVAYLRHVPLLALRPVKAAAPADQGGLEKVILLLRAQTGHDFTHYKRSTISRRIERRMGLHQLSRIEDYVRYLRETPAEADLLFKELLIGVTSFFRDPQAWDQLKSEAIPLLLAARPDGGVLRAWVPACSTGEEAYSLAMVFQEALARVKPAANFDLQVFATDLSREAIDRARAGSYLANIAADVSEDRLRRFFVEEGGGYRVGKAIRDMVVFATQDVVTDPPFTRLDLLLCRNLLIYLEPDLQKKLLALFHYSLNPGGILMLGNAETAGPATTLFEPLPGKERIYRRRDVVTPGPPGDFPAAFTRTAAGPVPAAPAAPAAPGAARSLQALTDALVLQHFSPPAVLATERGDIVYFSGKTGKFLEPAVGNANLNVFAMAREGLGAPLIEAFGRVARQREAVTVKGVKVGANGGVRIVELTVQPLAEPAALRGMMLIVFNDVTGSATSRRRTRAQQSTAQDARLLALEEELRQARDGLQTTLEEMQASQEELKSANEELQSTNEELQSANEELTTSKEEMQSMNEELQTVNHELQAKVDELSQASDDMKNLLNSTEIALLFLDDELRVRRFTTPAVNIIKLIPGDVGRPITDLTSTVDYAALAEDAREVLRTLVFREREVTDHEGQWFRARIMPYRKQDNRIDGVVITFVDITFAKALVEDLRQSLAAMTSRVAEQAADAKAARDQVAAGTPGAPASPAGEARPSDEDRQAKGGPGRGG